MARLVVNVGSTSVKIKVYNPHEVWSKTVETVGEALMNIRYASNMWHIDGIAHRIVDGGSWSNAPLIIGHEFVYDSILPTLAPNHNPKALQLITSIFEDEDLGGWTQVAVFDNTFHRTMPATSSVYPVPKYHDPRGQYRKSGFHGLACQSAIAIYENATETKFSGIITHLGGGCSSTAVVDGVSVDTTMGISPVDGIVMGTRCGSIDPMVVIDMVKHNGIEFAEEILSKESGLAYLSGLEKFDALEMIELADEGDIDCRHAVNTFELSVSKAIGSMIASWGFYNWGYSSNPSRPTLLFTGGIGFNYQHLVKRVLSNIGYRGQHDFIETRRGIIDDRIITYYNNVEQIDNKLAYGIDVNEESVMLNALTDLIDVF